MAEITIKIFDALDGSIDLDATFDPEFNPNHKTTPAQNFAGYVLQFIAKTVQEMKEHAEAQSEVASSTPDEEVQEQLASSPENAG
jgi:hypothetical protein